jgi:hypothetical protein
MKFWALEEIEIARAMAAEGKFVSEIAAGARRSFGRPPCRGRCPRS